MTLPNELYEQVIILLLNSWLDELLQPANAHRMMNPLKKPSPLRSNPKFADVDYPDTLLNFARASRTWAPRVEFHVGRYRDRIFSSAQTDRLSFEARLAMGTHLACIQHLSVRPVQSDAEYNKCDLLRRAAHSSWPQPWILLRILPRLREVLEELGRIKKANWRECGTADYDDLGTELEELVAEENRDYRDEGWMLCQSRQRLTSSGGCFVLSRR